MNTMDLDAVLDAAQAAGFFAPRKKTEAAACCRELIPDREQLRKLDDSALWHGLLAAHAAEKRFTLRVVLHLLEIERRSLHLREGYGSLFDYCTVKLKYSASAAVRRIRAARCIRDYPQVYWKLKSGELNLSTVTQVAGIVNRDNAADVFKRIAGKSQREVAGVVAEYKPEAALPERAVPVCLKKTCSDGAKEYLHKVKLEFSVSPESFRKLEMIQLLLSNKYPQGATLEQAFDEILEDYYERHAPERKAARRLAREARKAAPTDKPGKRKVHKIGRNRSGCRLRKASPPQREERSGKASQEAAQEHSRYIPPAVKEAVFTRDGGCCSKSSGSAGVPPALNVKSLALTERAAGAAALPGEAVPMKAKQHQTSRNRSGGKSRVCCSALTVAQDARPRCA